MKKIIAVISVLAIVLSMCSCSRRGDDMMDTTDDSGKETSSSVTDTGSTSDTIGEGSGAVNSGEGGAEGILGAVWSKYGEDERFAAIGGDMNASVSDAPGAFDISDTDTLDSTLGLPASLAGQVVEAASLMHMMNANTFTSACYKLKDGTDVKEFANALEGNVMSRQWICGTPETFLVLNVDNQYVISAFGADDLIKTFKSNAMEAIGTVSVVMEKPIVE